VTDRVTDAAFDAAHRLLAVRTYAAVYLVPVAGPPWRVDRRLRATACRLWALGEPQGEGVAFAAGPPATLLLSSETNFRGRGGLASAACPPPARGDAARVNAARVNAARQAAGVTRPPGPRWGP
jgi:hypothetical protein